ncbi:hypothetical protein PENSPDRAFT_101757 [Peniophora sp. CONT]|nr:hypothetical protein PENSPDRAFT_101757 [Peniophora sp. CONT]
MILRKCCSRLVSARARRARFKARLSPSTLFAGHARALPCHLRQARTQLRQPSRCTVNPNSESTDVSCKQAQ